MAAMMSGGLLWLTMVMTFLSLAASQNYVELLGTKASTPLMKCSSKSFTHLKSDGEGLDIDLLSGSDGVLNITKNKDETFNLEIKLNEDVAKNNHLFLGEWKCDDQTWIVVGEPHINRLSLDWEVNEKHPLSMTVNEGNQVTLICEAYVVAKPNVVPEFTWGIDAETGVSEGPSANLSRWSASDPIEIQDNVWTANYTLVAADGITKDDRYSYKCTVKAGEDRFQRSRSMLLRVKGKFAVLWPTIGIIIEVLLLSIGTFVYEKKKAKRDSAGTEPKDGDSSDTGLVQPSSSTGAVRKRNTVKT